ncbi:MAG: cyclic nucleotide-binding domain-containing protein [Chloroflexaceae bacterium]|nr:cyclic nucleotide-binding domain-containing protein [Chloroflexaceae bacterium]
MLSIEDKIQILKTVSIFAETPAPVLMDIVPVLEDVYVECGETIFQKGDLGSSMYIIVDGEVRVHDGDMFLNFLGKRAVFGEMAALDPEPRSASVTAVVSTHLFCLQQHAFYRLMEGRIEIVRGVVHVLCQHLRARMRDLLEDFTYMQQFARITAAASAVEAGVFQLDSLNDIAQRTDELGQLARVFQAMTREVFAREQRLKQQVQELRIEVDMIHKDRQVAEITESDYFQSLQQKVKDLRQRSRSGQDIPDTSGI